MQIIILIKYKEIEKVLYKGPIRFRGLEFAKEEGKEELSIIQLCIKIYFVILQMNSAIRGAS